MGSLEILPPPIQKDELNSAKPTCIAKQKVLSCVP
jgi:hypothetical protein